MNIKEALDQIISAELTSELQDKNIDEPGLAIIKQANRAEFGEYQANGIMSAAKKLQSDPRDLATSIVDRLDLDHMVEKLEVAGPGFINIHLSSEFLGSRVSEMLENDRLLIDLEQPETIVIDYSSPNLAKEMHIGHLRSTTIGDSLARILEYKGHNVVRANHMGDWGAQFGSLLAYMDQLSDTGNDLFGELADLEKFYQHASQLFREDAKFAAKAREFVVRLQSGDPKCTALWQQFISESIHHCQTIYERLNITLTADDIFGESFYNKLLPVVESDLSAADLLVESDGAMCVFLEGFKAKDGSPLPAIIRKSDGGYPYMATDLAAVKYRSQTLNASRALYFIDSRQSLHLKQLFAISHAVGYLEEKHDFRHLPNGTIMGEDGKPFKTRTGGAVKLADVLDEAESRAHGLVSSKSSDLDEDTRTDIAKVVGIGAVKYAELSKNRTSDYTFNWDSMLSFDGNTAPYLQYAYTRIISIFRKAGVQQESLSGSITLDQSAEKALAIKLVQFPEVLDAVTADCTPNLLCNYLFELAGLFMSFYEACPVIKADADVRTSRLLLCKVTAATLKKGLELLGIGTVERM